VAYWSGGGMGLCLLLLRVGVIESGVYKDLLNKKHVKKGSIMMFFNSWDRFARYLKCIGIGLPTWFCIGILAMFANQFGTALGLKGEIKPGMAIMWAYIGISAGDFLSGFISHYLKSRKKAILYMMYFTLVGVSLMLFFPYKTAGMYYFYCVWLGLGTGYWAMFVTVGAEQFGTNIRSTAATTIPNMVRGTVVLMTLLFDYSKVDIGVIFAAVLVGVISFAIGIYSTISIPETHNRDMDFLEE
ncbi:MAG: MFS transporter, partial [Flavobacteriia bacterium]